MENLFGGACKTNVDKIHKLQKCAVRTISNSHYRSRPEQLFFKYDILKVYNAYKTGSWCIYVLVLHKPTTKNL